jgi:hypothetical protein
MLVGTVYKIADAATWRNALSEAEQNGELVPEGLALLLSVHSAGGDYAFDLWQGASVDFVRNQLDAITARLSTNIYFHVDPSHPATMLPRSTHAE